MKKPTPLTKKQALKALDLCLIQDMHHIDVTTTYFRGQITTQGMWSIVHGKSHKKTYEEFLTKHSMTHEQAEEILRNQTGVRKAKRRKRR